MATNHRTLGSVSKETFTQADNKVFRALLFDLFAELYAHDRCQPKACREKWDSCGKKFKSIDERIGKIKLWNTAAGAISGFIGGFVAVLAKAKLWG